MKQEFTLAWEKMWYQHKKTKDALNMFAYAKKDSHALKEESREYEKIKQKEPKPTKPNEKQSYSKGQKVGLILGPLLFVLTLLFFHPEELSSEGRLIL